MNDNQPLHSLCRLVLIRLAVEAKDKSARKRRIMKLYEAGIIKAGETETLINRYGLKHS